MSELIIIRGNSGGGKSTVAKQLQLEMGRGAMLIQQDVVRREVLRIKGDAPGNHSLELMERMARYGRQIGYSVIIEGILLARVHREWLLRASQTWEHGSTYCHYIDLPFEETLRRHATKPIGHEYGEKEMRARWHEHDALGLPEERLIGKEMSCNEIVGSILDDIANKSEQRGQNYHIAF